MPKTHIRYAFILRLKDSEILVAGSAGKASKYQKEARKIRQKLLLSALKLSERKKINSPSFGKWLSVCDANKLIYCVCIPSAYSEKLGNQFLDVKPHPLFNPFPKTSKQNFPEKKKISKEKKKKYKTPLKNFQFQFQKY